MIFIAGNMPMKTEITPLLIMIKLEQYDYAGATAIALVMLLVSFALLLAINLLQPGAAAGGCGRDGALDGRRRRAIRGAPPRAERRGALTEPRWVRWLADRRSR